MILVQENIAKETEIYNKAIEIKENAEKVFSDFIKTEVDKRISEQNKMLIKAREIAKEMNQLWFNWKWFKATFKKAVSDWKGGTSIIKETKIINYNTIHNDVDVNKIWIQMAREVSKQRKN